MLNKQASLHASDRRHFQAATNLKSYHNMDLVHLYETAKNLYVLLPPPAALTLYCVGENPVSDLNTVPKVFILGMPTFSAIS